MSIVMEVIFYEQNISKWLSFYADNVGFVKTTVCFSSFICLTRQYILKDIKHADGLKQK